MTNPTSIEAVAQPIMTLFYNTNTPADTAENTITNGLLQPSIFLHPF